ncbi:MAG: hypothetical protein JNL50_13535 [Phycisphaerae bacterium]|nr:hypothetical protein [Phycisphaerae bacterium]
MSRTKASEGGKRTRRRIAWVAVWIGLVGLVAVLSSSGRLWGIWSRGFYVVVDRGLFDVVWFPQGHVRPSPMSRVLFDTRATDWAWPRWGVDRTEGLVRVPVWMVFCMVGALGGTGVWRNRAIEGFCARCGYELSGLSASNGVVTCPECGEKNSPTTALPREVRAARRRGAWSIGVGALMAAAMIVACARGLTWSWMLKSRVFSSVDFERGAIIYHVHVWNPFSDEFVGDGVTSELEWWRVVLPRLEWGSSNRYVRVPLWPIPAALIGWGLVRRFRACRGAGLPPATPGGGGAAGAGE